MKSERVEVAENGFVLLRYKKWEDQFRRLPTWSACRNLQLVPIEKREDEKNYPREGLKW